MKKEAREFWNNTQLRVRLLDQIDKVKENYRVTTNGKMWRVEKHKRTIFNWRKTWKPVKFYKSRPIYGSAYEDGFYNFPYRSEAENMMRRLIVEDTNELENKLPFETPRIRDVYKFLE